MTSVFSFGLSCVLDVLRLSLFGISYVEGRGVLNLSFSRVGSGVGVVVVGEESIERW